MTRPVACMGKASRCFRVWAISAASLGYWSVSPQTPPRNPTRSSRCVLPGPPLHCANDWARPSRLPSNRNWRRSWNSRVARSVMMLVWLRGWKAGPCPWIRPSSKRLAPAHSPLFELQATDSSTCATRVDHSPHRRDPIGRKSSAAGMFPDCFLVRCQVHAINFIAGDVAVQPLNLRPHSLQYVHRFSGDFLQFLLRKIPRARDFPFYHVFRHRHLTEPLIVPDFWRNSELLRSPQPTQERTCESCSIRSVI